MVRKIGLALAVGGLEGCLLLGTAAADPPASTDWDHHRAGHPQSISCLAVPTDTGHYVGYYVGGGCPRPHKAERRCPDEGTWGWDYQGWLLPRRVILGWWHGRRYQGGTGAYKTDGPRLLGEVEEREAKKH